MTPSDPEFAYLAHDLSQLLWAIQGRARVLAARLGPDAALAVTIAEDAAAAAAMLADDVEPAADPVAVAMAAWRQARDRAAALGGDPEAVAWSGPADAPPVAVPPSVLRRILGNLFANALEAIATSGRISWDVVREDDRIRIGVQDSGPGVPAELRPRLFAAGATSGKAGGHGLGLAGSRALARRYGGDLTCCETDAGARFELTLPAAPARPRESVAVATAPSRPLRILVVDDEAPVREMLADLLTSEGHAANLAPDHDAALAHWTTGRYDAALIDLGLPGKDGAELARSLREHDPTPALVMLTGWGRENDLANLDPGLADFTAIKPIDLPQLRELLGRAATLTAGRRGPATSQE